jgi:hypothetical protein
MPPFPAIVQPPRQLSGQAGQSEARTSPVAHAGNPVTNPDVDGVVGNPDGHCRHAGSRVPQHVGQRLGKHAFRHDPGRSRHIRQVDLPVDDQPRIPQTHQQGREIRLRPGRGVRAKLPQGLPDLGHRLPAGGQDRVHPAPIGIIQRTAGPQRLGLNEHDRGRLPKSVVQPPRRALSPQRRLEFGDTRPVGKLGLAERTVKVHVGNVLAKLGVPSRTQAALQAEAVLRG